MSTPVLITEIRRRAETGVSVNPFFCRTEGARDVYVKPAGTLPESLVREWLGSRLARAMNLPVAEFDLVEVPKQVVDAVLALDTSGLRAGVGFGSYDVGTGSRDAKPNDMKWIEDSLLAQILAFDHWIQNGDRQLTQLGGNPNAIVGPSQENLFLIDHDSAFDPTASPADFGQHLGWGMRHWWNDSKKRKEWQKKGRTSDGRVR